uniref:HAUS augmin-like complex subunit 8 n=1 Tax=Jaculus jaculus TaxID=51337 RepID=UPI0003332D1B|nr:HAUS augmin-like complex subunit 8 [Jaculus jaculus]
MADFSERGAGKIAAASNNPSVTKAKGKRIQGGRVVESRYLQYEKRTKKTPSAEALKSSGKLPEGGRKVGALQKSKEDNGINKGDLQSTLLEGHGTAPPDLDLSAINEKCMVRRAPQLDKRTLEKTESMSLIAPRSTSFAAPRKKSPDLPEVMDMMESQTLLLSLLAVKIENSLAQLEEKAEKHLSAICREQERLQRQAHELKHRLLLSHKQQELAATLGTQMELLGPFKAVAKRFKEQYMTLATALDSTRHELPMRSIHLEGSGQELLDTLQPALRTTYQLLGELSIDTSEADVQVLRLLDELKDVTAKKDLELRRTISQVLELSAEASKEAALLNQEVWEEAKGTTASSQWYFNPDGGPGDPPGELQSTVPSEDHPSCTL